MNKQEMMELLEKFPVGKKVLLFSGNKLPDVGNIDEVRVTSSTPDKYKIVFVSAIGKEYFPDEIVDFNDPVEGIRRSHRNK